MAGAVILIGGALISTALIGCSDPQRRYEVLSVFFDGVPDPSAPKKEPGRSTSTGRRTYVHKPFADNLCNSCHLNTSDIFARAQVREDVCLNCHANVPTQYPVMHGPVVNNACQMCHASHSSAVPHLLKRAAPEVCTQCHEPEAMMLMHRAFAFNPQQSCIDCHSAHGGSDHRLLLAHPAEPTPLAPVPTAAPAPAATAAPAGITPGPESGVPR